MTNFRYEKGKDFWFYLNELIENLKSTQRNELANEIAEVGRRITGMTDSWHKFLNDFKELLNRNRSNLTEFQNELADFLLNSLKQQLTKY